jgi:hypothetical protein
MARSRRVRLVGEPRHHRRVERVTDHPDSANSF